MIDRPVVLSVHLIQPLASNPWWVDIAPVALCGGLILGVVAGVWTYFLTRQTATAND
jgi:uncharacterized protein (DUF2062 family)